ncbi:MAG: hypothetical protein ACRC1D_00040, partial [Culicoidibacterales bacterium]
GSELFYIRWIVTCLQTMNLNKQQLQAQSLACVRWFKRLKLETLVIGLVVIHILAICNYVFIFPTLPLQVYFTFNSVLLISYLFLWCVSLAKAKATRTRLFLIGHWYTGSFV